MLNSFEVLVLSVLKFLILAISFHLTGAKTKA